MVYFLAENSSKEQKEDQRKFEIPLVSPMLLPLLTFVMMKQHCYPLRQVILLITHLTAVLTETQ
jgi:hypothetical protein